MYATDDRYRDDVHIRGGCITASEKSQYAVSQLGMNAMPPAAVVPRRGVARRVARAARADAAVAPRRGSASRPTGRTGAEARWPPTTRRSSAPCSRSPAGATRTSTRRSGSRSGASTRSGGRSSATGSTRSPTTPTRARTSTGCASSSGSSTITSTASRTAGTGSPRSPGSSGHGRGRSGSPRRGPAGGGRPAACRCRADVGARRCTWARARSRPRPRREAGVGRVWRTGRPSGTSGGLSWGAGWPPNGLARDLRPDEERGLTWTTEAPGRADVGHRHARRPILYLSATMPVATCVVRLSEVSPDGGVGARRDGGPEPDPPALGHATRSRCRWIRARRPSRCGSRCAPRGYRFTPGHRIRLTVLTSYWPALWPSPFPGELLRLPRPGGALAARAAGVAGRRAHARGRRRSRRRRPGCARSARASPTSRSGGPRRIRRRGRSRVTIDGWRGERRRGRLPHVLRRSDSCSPPRTRIRPTRAWRATSSTAGRSRAYEVDIRAYGDHRVGRRRRSTSACRWTSGSTASRSSRATGASGCRDASSRSSGQGRRARPARRARWLIATATLASVPSR